MYRIRFKAYKLIEIYQPLNRIVFISAFNDVYTSQMLKTLNNPTRTQCPFPVPPNPTNPRLFEYPCWQSIVAYNPPSEIISWVRFVRNATNAIFSRECTTFRFRPRVGKWCSDPVVMLDFYERDLNGIQTDNIMCDVRHLFTALAPKH